MRRCASSLPYSYHDLFMMHALPYTRQRQLLVYGKRSRVRNSLAGAEDCRHARNPYGHRHGSGGKVDEVENGEATVESSTSQANKVILTHCPWLSTLRPSPDAPPGDNTFLAYPRVITADPVRSGAQS